MTSASLNKNLITQFVWCLKKEKGCGTETFSIDRVLNKDYFYGKIMQKLCTKASSRKLINFGK